VRESFKMEFQVVPFVGNVGKNQVIQGVSVKNKKEQKKNIIFIDGKKYEIVHYDFLPSGTIALSTDIYYKYKSDKND
jgi:hypothetical protein